MNQPNSLAFTSTNAATRPSVLLRKNSAYSRGQVAQYLCLSIHKCTTLKTMTMIKWFHKKQCSWIIRFLRLTVLKDLCLKFSRTRSAQSTTRLIWGSSVQNSLSMRLKSYRRRTFLSMWLSFNAPFKWVEIEYTTRVLSTLSGIFLETLAAFLTCCSC